MNGTTTVLVVGATGNVGGQVVAQLLEAGVNVRALARNPDLAGLSDAVQVVRGDLTVPESLTEAAEGVDAVFFLWPLFDADRAPEAVAALSARCSCIVYLSSIGDGLDQRPDGFWGEVEELVERSSASWTFLRPSGFASNALEWADQIRTDGTVHSAYADAARSAIHEADIAAVAVRVLTERGHAGKAYHLTGPGLVSQAEQVRLIGEATGRPTHWVEISVEEARQRLLVELPDAHFVDEVLRNWQSLTDDAEPVTDTVEKITGLPARTFAQWARDHVDDFRPPSAEVGSRHPSP